MTEEGMINSKMCIDFLAGGFKDFFNFHPYYLGKMMPFCLIFFRWVCSTTNQFFMFFNHVFTPKLVGNFILFWWKPIEQQPIETFHRRKSQQTVYVVKSHVTFFLPRFWHILRWSTLLQRRLNLKLPMSFNLEVCEPRTGVGGDSWEEDGEDFVGNRERLNG